MRLRIGPSSGLVLPEINAAQQPALVGDDLYVFRGQEFDLFGVAASEVEMVPVKQSFGGLDSVLEEFVPLLLAEFVQAAATEIVLVRHAPLTQDVVANFKARAEVPVGEQGPAKSGAQGEH